MRRGISPFYAASVQFNPRLNRRDENIEALYEVVRQAAGRGQADCHAGDGDDRLSV